MRFVREKARDNLPNEKTYKKFYRHAFENLPGERICMTLRGRLEECLDVLRILPDKQAAQPKRLL